MAVMEVIKYGHPTLRKVAEPCSPDDFDDQFLDDMIETMQEEDGVGLAAPQINVSKRLIVVSDLTDSYIIFNPEIIAHSESTKVDTEGCLSLPGLQAQVPRYNKIVVRGQDRKGETFETTASGLLAVVFQHEIDHLDGKMYLDRADLKTLVWLNKIDDTDEFTKEFITLDKVQQRYKELYHKDRRDIVFD